MPHIDDLIRALDELLDPAAFDDYGPNGLQVPGPSEVRRVVTGVSAQRPLAERAVELGAELVLVHHGLFWEFLPVGLTPVLAERLRPLFKHDVGHDVLARLAREEGVEALGDGVRQPRSAGP